MIYILKVWLKPCPKRLPLRVQREYTDRWSFEGLLTESPCARKGFEPEMAKSSSKHKNSLEKRVIKWTRAFCGPGRAKPKKADYFGPKKSRL
jgi:hypothetical protein